MPRKTPRQGHSTPWAQKRHLLCEQWHFVCHLKVAVLTESCQKLKGHFWHNHCFELTQCGAASRCSRSPCSGATGAAALAAADPALLMVAARGRGRGHRRMRGCGGAVQRGFICKTEAQTKGHFNCQPAKICTLSTARFAFGHGKDPRKKSEYKRRAGPHKSRHR